MPLDLSTDRAKGEENNPHLLFFLIVKENIYMIYMEFRLRRGLRPCDTRYAQASGPG